MTRMVLKLVGGLLIAFGIIWTLQGLGVLRWPAGSMMLARTEWAVYGGLTAAVGGALAALGFRPSRG
jgi:uncharacterized membrane protein